MFFDFVNYYKRFIYRYSQISGFFTGLLKNNKNDKKFEFFEWLEKTDQAFRRLRDIFFSIFFLHHFDSIKKIKIEINVFDFGVIDILSQSNIDDYWRSMTFWSRKMILTKQNYKIHDQKLLVIVQLF